MKSSYEKYRQLLDVEVQGFVERTESCYPADTANASIVEQRKLYDQMCHQFAQDLPKNIFWSDRFFEQPAGPDIAVRVYTQKSDLPLHSGQEIHSPVIVYLHGGGFVVGGLDSHHDVCAELARETGLTVFAIDYRLAPEHLHPASFNDAMNVVSQLAAEGLSIVLCGDSAGANLAAAVSGAVSTRQPQSIDLLGQVLIYPGLGGELLATSDASVRNCFDDALPMPPISYSEHEFAPMLTLADVHFYHRIRVADENLLTETDQQQQPQQQPQQQLSLIAPLLNNRFDGLPKTICFGAQCDPLHGDGLYYCDAISRAGGDARFVSEPGLVHGYLRARHSSRKAAKSFQRIVAALQACLQ